MWALPTLLRLAEGTVKQKPAPVHAGEGVVREGGAVQHCGGPHLFSAVATSNPLSKRVMSPLTMRSRMILCGAVGATGRGPRVGMSTWRGRRATGRTSACWRDASRVGAASPRTCASVRQSLLPYFRSGTEDSPGSRTVSTSRFFRCPAMWPTQRRRAPQRRVSREHLGDNVSSLPAQRWCAYQALLCMHQLPHHGDFLLLLQHLGLQGGLRRRACGV